METTLERLRERAEEVVRRAPTIEAVVLFGSRARGTSGPGSDWDIGEPKLLRVGVRVLAVFVGGQDHVRHMLARLLEE